MGVVEIPLPEAETHFGSRMRKWQWIFVVVVSMAFSHAADINKVKRDSVARKADTLPSREEIAAISPAPLFLLLI